MKVKVCGLKYLDNILNVTELNVDYIGFIFYKNSPRYIGNSFGFEEARQIPRAIKKVGVFVNESAYSILNSVAHYDLDLVQLHGTETEFLCAELKPYVKIIRAFSINENFDFAELERYAEHVNYFLFDTPTIAYGGSGTAFDWRILNKYNNIQPYFLSGGIDTEILSQLEKINVQKPYALDVNSKFEVLPGQKDINKINEFLEKLKTV